VSNELKKELKVDCPTCKKKVIWNNEFEYRPFCSHRCKLIDLGEWASESYTIPAAITEEDLYNIESTESTPTLQ